jgi:hypothetical protein
MGADRLCQIPEQTQAPNTEAAPFPCTVVACLIPLHALAAIAQPRRRKLFSPRSRRQRSGSGQHNPTSILFFIFVIIIIIIIWIM